MTIYERVKARLDGVEDVPSDAWVAEAIKTLSDRVCMRIGVGELPAMAESIGIIPARAGNRRAAVARTRAPRDHPRACGEQVNPSP